MSKYRTLSVPQDEQLPPISTEVPGRSYSFAGFIVEWVLSSKGMRQDENLEHLFEVQSAIEAAQKPGDAFKVRLIYPWAQHILRHYHSLMKAELT